MYSPSSYGVFSGPQPEREYRKPTTQESEDWAKYKAFRARNDYIQYGIPLPEGVTFESLGLRGRP
jgi:hypothetical protein